jgi:predicted transcriptional regulator of viral defense system
MIPDLFYTLAEQRRRITASWRILILLRRIKARVHSPLPNASTARGIERRLVGDGSLAVIDGVRGVYRVNVPYAESIPVSTEQIVQEASPWSVLSHLTALAHHGLTDIIPQSIHATRYAGHSQRLPLGTVPEDWVEFPAAKLHQQPERIEHTPVSWVQTKGEWEFGIGIVYSHGVPLYMTDPERTLLDALRRPDESGGIINVLRAWRRGIDLVRVDVLTDYADRLGKIMRQRVGFILQRLCVNHPRLGDWRRDLVRGSSVRLLANEPFSPTFSSEWNLSLNVPAEVLGELDE